MRLNLAIFLAVFTPFVFGISITDPAPVSDAAVEACWDIPITRENGDVLAVHEISGYEIAYGTLGPSQPTFVGIDNGSTECWTSPNLPDNTYEFAVRAIDTNGLISKWSNKVVVEIKKGSPPEKPGNFEVIFKRIVAWVKHFIFKFV